MSDKIELSFAQRFEMEKLTRAIDNTADLNQLQSIAKQLVEAWHTQKAATEWVIRQHLDGSNNLVHPQIKIIAIK